MSSTSDLFSTLNLTSSTIEKKFNELLAQLEEKNKIIGQLELELENNKSELEEKQKQIENLIKHKEGAESENQQIQTVKEKLEEQNASLKNEVVALNEKVKQLELEAATLHMRESDDIKPDFIDNFEGNEEEEETEEEQDNKGDCKTLQEDDDDDILVDTSENSKSKPNEFQSSSQNNTPNKQIKKRGPKASLDKPLPEFPTAEQLRKNYVKMEWTYESTERPFWTIINDNVYRFCNKQGGRDKQLKLKRSDNTVYSPTTNSTKPRVIEYYTDKKKK